jgi:pectinesterase
MKISFFLVSIFCISTAWCQKRITVAPDGSGDFRTIQAALDAVPIDHPGQAMIFIRKGIYREQVVVDARKSFITLLGEDPSGTVIGFNNHAGLKLPNGDTLNTWNCATVFIYGNDFHAENLTFENDAGFSAGQAVALRVEGTRASFKNCRMVGFQDVLFLSGSGAKHYFENCYIEGTTDFIFGPSTAVFLNCRLHSKKNSHVTAASTPREIPYGFVFIDCKLTADTSLHKVSLGRPWQPNASVTYIRCEIGKHIIPEGWNNWKNPNNESTARFAEYQCYGEGANPSSRVGWSRQLTDDEAKRYTVENILGEWNGFKKSDQHAAH